ncbi:MAG TPA: glycosyltransferase family 4 protein [Kofleriaceae bacterium]|nr:glycosyltransferase family 4 protein [Kofleriaceae bacterium]
MRIAQVSPLYERVPPIAYGGTERVVAYLTDELVERGHEVTLFASGDSITRAELVPGCERSLRLGGNEDPIAAHVAMIDEVFRRAERGDFDVIHFHTDYLHFPLLDREPYPALTTTHGRLDLGDHAPLFRRFAHLRFASISDAQRAPMSWLDWIGTVHHGLPIDLHPAGSGGGYLAFLGRLSPEKGCEDAIAIAARAGLPLAIAGKRDRHDLDYCRERLDPLIAGPGVEFIGEIGGRAKDDFLGGARALLFPIDWPEPFGLVMIEAMACGTPVIAYRRGSVPEVIDHGVTGFVVDSIDEAVRAVDRCAHLDRATVRATFEARFSAARMADDYLALYDQLGSQHGRDLVRHLAG